MITKIANALNDLKHCDIDQLFYHLNRFGCKFVDSNSLKQIIVNQISVIQFRVTNNSKVCNNSEKSNNNNNIQIIFTELIKIQQYQQFY